MQVRDVNKLGPILGGRQLYNLRITERTGQTATSLVGRQGCTVQTVVGG